jgi:hypothetical protein
MNKCTKQPIALFCFALISSILLLYSNVCLSQVDNLPTIYKDQSFDNNIKTAQFHLNDLILSTPILSLQSGSILTLDFDDLYPETRPLSYAIQLCNYDWTPNTQLSPFDFTIGFLENALNTYNLSFNTNQKYTHFSLAIPNKDCTPKIAGNYVLLIYDNSDTKKLILVKRFLVTSNQVEIDGEFLRPRNVKLANTHQQIEFTINTKGLDISNPFQDLKVVIQQNMRPDNIKMDLQPNFVQDNLITFSNNDDCVLEALKEYRKLDIRTDRFRSNTVAAIDIDSASANDNRPLSVFNLYAEPLRSFKQFVYQRDFNGSYIVEKQEAVKHNVESDYAWVNFSMPFSTKLQNGNFYICGQISNYDTIPEFIMHYNSTVNAYQAKILLKQGFYDYLIGFWENDQSKFDFSVAEGNWYETENEYNVYVYYHPFSARYDQLIGVRTIRTRQ